MGWKDMTYKERMLYYGDISSSKYEFSARRDPVKMEPAPPIDSILVTNKDMEPYVVQAAGGRLAHFGDDYLPLQFVHFGDVHGRMELWNRIVEYINHYRDDIAFGVHAGDYHGAYHIVYRDFYNYGTICANPILNCVGNHDTYADAQRTPATKEQIYNRLFNVTHNWDVNFMAGEYTMAYYKDFPDNGIRLVVLDLYHDVEEQKIWLKQVLAEAKQQGYSIISVAHELTGKITEPAPVTFTTIQGEAEVIGEKYIEPWLDQIYADFMAEGGKFICHLAGHYHHDLFGYTANGVLNIAVECATDWGGHTDGRRVRGTKTYDCFNVVSADVCTGLLKLVRIGNPCDMYLRSKKVLCYDYINKKVISNF